MLMESLKKLIVLNMKNLFLIITLLIASCAAQAQNEIQKIAAYSVPQETEKQDKQKLQTYLDKRKNTTMNLKVRSGEFYKLGDVLIYINAAEGNAKPDRLEEDKRQHDIVFSGLDEKISSSEIKMINGVKVLIRHLVRADFNYYYFTAINSSGSKIVTGKLEFAKSDETKAKAILNHILASLKFK